MMTVEDEDCTLWKLRDAFAASAETGVMGKNCIRMISGSIREKGFRWNKSSVRFSVTEAVNTRPKFSQLH